MAYILVIQGRDVVRALLRELLERAGHIVQETAEGLKGLRCLHEWAMDLVITDIHLSDCDGLEFIGTLRQEFPAVKILAVSAQKGTEDDDLLVSKILGADAVVQDALDGEALLNAVEELLLKQNGN
jgi:CheY-like chemotaxis protein